jgi:hypothetical protein
MSQTCGHLDQVDLDATPSSTGCEDWVWCYSDEFAFLLDGLPEHSHP